VNGTDLKAMIYGRDWLYDGYVVLPRELGILEGFEVKCEAGEIGWSVSSAQKNSSKQAPY